MELKVGDLVKWRNIDVQASFDADHRGGVWIERTGVVAFVGRMPSGGSFRLVRVIDQSTGIERIFRCNKLEVC
tara:strand:- start:576 stop:794 length:219 start_codon:yes stop_codon:yes gene_type:complete